MSNQIIIQPCECCDYQSSTISFGYRFYDNYDKTYNNLWTEEDMDLSPIEIIEKIYKEDRDNISVFLFFENVVDNKLNILVGDELVEWDQIKVMLTVKA